jgi:hypothetical protein
VFVSVQGFGCRRCLGRPCEALPADVYCSAIMAVGGGGMGDAEADTAVLCRCGVHDGKYGP